MATVARFSWGPKLSSTLDLSKPLKPVDDKRFVIAPDSHVLSEKELEEARRLEPPVSTGDAPDTRAATTQSIEIERARRQIKNFDKRIEEHLSWRAKAKAAGKYVGDEDLDPDLLDLRRKKASLEREIARLEQPAECLSTRGRSGRAGRTCLRGQPGRKQVSLRSRMVAA